MAACQQRVAEYPQPQLNLACVDKPNDPPGSGGNIEARIYGGTGGFDSGYKYLTGGKCAEAQSYPASYGSNISVCRGGCMYAPEPGGTTDTVRSGSWLAQLRQTTYKPTGATCPPDAPPEPPMAGRTLCGGGSCHDTAAGKYCAVSSSGGQVCISDKPPPSGGCATDGDTTLCAGDPPPLPPNPPIGDPATDIAGSDTYGHQDGDGPVSHTTVNNYNNTGGAANNGAQSGDSGNAPDSPNAPPGSPNGPAPSSSSGGPGNKGTASGGQDCNTPPICAGDEPTCAVVSQVWLSRCKGGDQGQSNDGDTTVPGLDGIGEGPGAGFMRDVSVLDKLDGTGFGGAGQCPQMPTIEIPMFNVEFTQEWPQWCEILGMAGNIILLLAGFIALRILSE